MSDLDPLARRVLAILVAHLPKARAGQPQTYVSYKDVHDALGLSQFGPTYGDSLKVQGLETLANWTVSNKFPAITGLVIDRGTYQPGDGYFKVCGRRPDDFAWWKSEIAFSKTFDWSQYLPEDDLRHLPETPTANDLVAPEPERVCTTTFRILRDTVLARRVKQLHAYRCQVCGETITLRDGSLYAEAHHIRPLGAPHNGPDVAENILCLCPNHHVELDYGVRELILEELRISKDHAISTSHVDYHNNIIRGGAP